MTKAGIRFEELHDDLLDLVYVLRNDGRLSFSFSLFRVPRRDTKLHFNDDRVRSRN